MKKIAKSMLIVMIIALFLNGCVYQNNVYYEPDITKYTYTRSNVKCYHQAYMDFLENEGSILVIGKSEGKLHTWAELNGKPVRGNWDDYEEIARCYYSDEWLWLIGKWDAGQDTGAKYDMSGNWWVAEDGELYPRKEI